MHKLISVSTPKRHNVKSDERIFLTQRSEIISSHLPLMQINMNKDMIVCWNAFQYP